MSYLLSFNPFDLSKTIAFGVGVGVGIGMILRKIKSEKARQQEHLLSCLRQLAAEVRQLRETLVHTVSQVSSKSRLLTTSHSSDDDEFFDTERDSEPSCIEDEKLFLEKIDKLQEGSSAEQQDAYNMLISRTNQDASNSELLWRYARSQYQMSIVKEKAGDLQAQKFILNKGLQTGEAAIENNESYCSYKWYAILLGCNIKFMNTQNKIISGYKFKESIEKAIELNPNDAYCYFLLGRYCFEVFMLPWYMRKAATALFGEPPSATVEDALTNFLKAEDAKSGFYIENPLYIGKCYYHKWDYTNAKIWLRKVLKTQSKDDDDDKLKDEALQLLKKCV